MKHLVFTSNLHLFMHVEKNSVSPFVVSLHKWYLHRRQSRPCGDSADNEIALIPSCLPTSIPCWGCERFSGSWLSLAALEAMQCHRRHHVFSLNPKSFLATSIPFPGLWSLSRSSACKKLTSFVGIGGHAVISPTPFVSLESKVFWPLRSRFRGCELLFRFLTLS